ncbi:FAD linked oxidase domain protein [Metallosphaera sedula]|uniref:FAD linked oxidase domain protein n=2 Tax=Metallosphaera sedula TaxID=43687 RepID=A4YEQ0_METS5|nr:FAD-binding protein [Metallosphaera sedula]ABP94902.1 FAD linked oxidase domain protein [Metallosphaera sedula DSM 5348]AIM26889.1 FAD linked oxidase domain protein [Metallosphaera sedula]AKV75281.1 FAD-linked oxidase [Metallosphaera sedula]AKV77520.1 FAD-linked oxidase [Metallosphaera sedula]AKV79767.1 FAD-linked oxidase [Metallosphaera sedula]
MGIREELEGRFGDSFSDSLVERLSHTADMGFVPQLVWTGMKINIIPDYVVYPRNVEDLIDLVRIANKYNIPITPYGRGTNRYGNAIPADGGIVVDFSKLDKIQIDDVNKIAVIEAGATWKFVDIAAQAKGLQLRTFPSSYDSTVGGGVAGDALGVGSYQYGYICDNVAFVEMVNPKGELVRLEGKDLALVCGAEGTTGLIYRVGMRLRPFSPTESLVLSYDNFEQAYRGIGEFYRESIPAWHIQVRGPAISTYIAENFKASLAPEKWNMVVLYPSNVSSIVEPKLYKVAQNTGAKTFEGEWTGWWSFNHGVNAALRTKGLLIHQHGLIHYTKIKELVDGIQDNLGKLGDLTPDGGFDLDIDLERRETLLVNAFTQVSLTPTDKKILFELAKNTLMMEQYIKVGGSMLSVGIFVHKYAKNRLTAMGKVFQEMGVDRYEVMKKYKQEMDPNEIFNPGKVFEPTKRAKEVLDIVRKQNEAMRYRFGIGFAKRISPGGEIQGYKVTKKYLDVFTDYAIKCIDCAMCVTVCPQYRLIPQWPYAPKGMFDFTKGLISMFELYGRIDVPDSAIAEISGCHKCGLCDGVCPARIPISSMLIKLSSMVARKTPDETVTEIPIPEKYKDIISDDAEIGVWLGKYLAENPSTMFATLEMFKKLGLKVKVFGTSMDSGFNDYISGNGNELIEKIKKNSEHINVVELITVSPEDYKTFTEGYQEYSRLSGVNQTFEVVPLDLRLLKSMQIEGNEELNLHVACFSNTYADEILKRLREKGFKVRKVEGCSGATLEKNVGKRADMMAKALGERYGTLVTLCPLAAVKFRSVGVNAKTLVEFLAEKVGAGVKVEQKIVKIPDADKNAIINVLVQSLTESLKKRASVIADTVSFMSSGMDEYKKIIEPIVTEAIDEATPSVKNAIVSMASSKYTGNDPSEKALVLNQYYREFNSILMSLTLDTVVSSVVSEVKSKSVDEFSERDLGLVLLELLREKMERIRTNVVQ